MSMLSSLVRSTAKVLVPVHREGYPFIGVLLGAAFLSSFLVPGLTSVLVVLAALVALFFRDPPRVTPVSDTLVVAPADGLVSAVGEAIPPPEMNLGEEPRQRISIFLSVLDVHINRVPASGRIAAVAYTPGLFLNADLDKASADNERNAIVIETARGAIGVVQIAGLIARRIVCWVRPRDEVAAGERFGLIRFGSRTDLYLPPGVEPMVGVGQRCVGGETVVADLARRDLRLSFRTS